MSDPLQERLISELRAQYRPQMQPQRSRSSRLLTWSGLDGRRGTLAFVLMVSGPLLVWAAWNLCGLGENVGLGPLSLWQAAAVAVFLAASMWGRMLIVTVVFVSDPGFLHVIERLQAPPADPFTFLGIGLLLMLAARDTVTVGRAPDLGRRI